MYREKVILKVSGNINKFIDKCIRRKIELLDISYINKDCALIRIYLSDLENVERYNYYSEIKVFKILGFKKIFLFVKNKLLFFITFIFCFCLMFFLENVIFDVNIIHSNQEIIELVKKELDNTGIKVLTIGKSFNELEKIRLKIIENNPKKLEWLSITKVGMKYIVRVEERILTDIKENSGYCHIVAKKSGIIKKIKSTAGEILPRIDDYVREGDTLISGEIHLYDNVKDNVCAEGDVWAEVWYKVNISMPYEYFEKEYTGNERYNFSFNKKILFKEKYQAYDINDIYKFNVFGLSFKYYKELEYRNVLKKYSKEEALEEALKQVDLKMQLKLKENGKVIHKKILKKDEFNSRIDIEVFVETLENIASIKNYEIESDINDTTE